MRLIQRTRMTLKSGLPFNLICGGTAWKDWGISRRTGDPLGYLGEWSQAWASGPRPDSRPWACPPCLALRELAYCRRGSYTPWPSPFSSLWLYTCACAIFVLRPLIFPSRLSPVVTNSRQLSAQLGNWRPMCFILQPRLPSTGRLMDVGYNCRGYLSITLARLQLTWEEQSFVFPLLRTG